MFLNGDTHFDVIEDVTIKLYIFVRRKQYIRNAIFCQKLRNRDHLYLTLIDYCSLPEFYIKAMSF